MEENQNEQKERPAETGGNEKREAVQPQSVHEKDMPGLRAGQIVRVHQRIQEGEKSRIQVFEGTVLAVKHGKGMNGTFTVRKVSEGIGVERIFPTQSPLIEKVEIKKRAKVRKATLYHLRHPKARRLKIVG